jgi:hypothetical protein
MYVYLNTEHSSSEKYRRNIHSESWRQDSIEAQKTYSFSKNNVVETEEARVKDNLRGRKNTPE